ncbi:MAG TPA: sigma-70 family RNA polymerase sigma factor [Actinomycetota bacterium]|nr:sigma-70 family RNA polymerase sigma factor [Actinomycetota bacterium]
MEAGLDFSTFYRAEYQRVFKAIVLSCGDRDMAHEVTQDAFAHAYVRWRRLSRKEWAGGWVMTTALNMMRKEGKRRSTFSPNVAEGAHPVESLNAKDLDLVKALRGLAPRQRTAVVLHYLEDMPVDMIATQMHIAPGTVKALLFQARKNLQKDLRDES